MGTPSSINLIVTRDDLVHMVTSDPSRFGLTDLPWPDNQISASLHVDKGDRPSDSDTIRLTLTRSPVTTGLGNFRD